MHSVTPVRAVLYLCRCRCVAACAAPSLMWACRCVAQEGGAGSPGLTYAGVVDALAAAGRRACYYDRLGFGHSDEAIKPSYVRRVSPVWVRLHGGAAEHV